MGKPKFIASKDLKAYLTASKRTTRLLGATERHVLSQPFEERSQDHIHPSDIIKPEWCAKAQYHSLLLNHVETRDRVPLRLRRIFETGTDAHTRWQALFNEQDKLWGKWECSDCLEYFYATSPHACIKCVSLNINYREVPLRSDKHMIAGHSDGWIKDDLPDTMIEIKTIGEGTMRLEVPMLLMQADNNLTKAWNNIRSPFPTHLRQGQMYLHLAHLMVEEDLLESAPGSITFIYDFKASQDYKEFEVEYNPEFVEDIFKKASDVVWAVKNEREPLCNIDSVKGCKRCEPHN